MENDYDYDNSGISLFTIIKVGFGRKILFLIVFACVALVMFLCIHFLYSNGKVTYITSYNYDIKAIENNKYLDGSNFNMSDIVSVENLEKIKESDSKYSSINVDSIIKSNGIKLESIAKQADSSTGEVAKNYSKITIKATLLSNRDVAISFLKAIVETPLNQTISLSNSLTYDNNLKAYTTANSYEQKISYLESQVTYLNENYNSLISSYGDLNVTINGVTKKISQYQNEINEYFGVYDINALNSQIRENGYVYKYDEYKDELQVQMTNIDVRLRLNQQKIDAITAERTKLIDEAKAAGLTSQVLDLSAYNTTLNTLNLEKVELQHTQEVLESKINKGATADTTTFDATLNTYYEKLVAFTNTYKNVSVPVIKDNNKVIYLDSSGISTSGGLSVVIELLISVVAGIVIALIVNLIVDREKLSSDYEWPKKNKKQELDNNPKSE